MNKTKKGPRIILFDLETLPDLKQVMKVFPSLSDYPGLTRKASINSIICMGWKELDSKKVHCVNAWDFKARWKKNINDDYDVVKAAYEVLKDADVVVTHNGKRFDWKFLQTRLMHHGFPPLPKIIHIDTLQEARKHLYVFNNRLGTIGEFLAGEKKLAHDGWPLWVGVMERSKKSMKRMTAYCKQDVLLLETIFKKLRPLIKSMPNLNMYKSGPAISCPSCGSTKLHRHGERVTKEKRYFRFQCQDCGSWSSVLKDKIKNDA